MTHFARLVLRCSLLLVLPGVGAASDLRNFEYGYLIPDEGYCDQPYVVILPDGTWLCTLTTGRGREGAGGQHVVATRSHDQGRTWSPLIDIESNSEPTSSWVVPVVTPSGRVYAFYSFNGDRVTIPDFKHSTHRRDDTLGWFVYKFSDDGGRTWSTERHRLPMPVAAVDRANEWQGAVQLFWGIDKPVIVGDDVVFGFTRIGSYFQEQGEGWFYRSDNLLTERDSALIRWTLSPENSRGVRNPAFGSTQEEHNVVPLANGDLFCLYRTRLGYPAQSYSRDGGRSWTEPELATYEPGGRKMKTPRACPTLWRTADGKFLFWSHNNSYEKGPSNAPLGARNVGWLTGGVEQDGFIHWSQPEPVCYQPDRKRGASYPDLVESGGRYFLSAANKEEARLIEIAPALVEGLWRQQTACAIAAGNLRLDADQSALAGRTLAMPRLPNLGEQRGGFAIDLWLELESAADGLILFDSRVPGQSAGILVKTTGRAALRLELNDGINATAWECDPGLVDPGRRHHVIFNVDAAPRLITVIVDGQLCDGGEGEGRPFGYTRFGNSDMPLTDKDLGDVSGGATMTVSGALQHLRIYDRYLTTSEAIGNYRFGVGLEP